MDRISYWILIIVIAIIIDFILGDPPSWPHPIRFIGWIIAKYEILIRKTFRNLYIGGGVLIASVLITTVLSIVIVGNILQLIHPVLLSIFHVYLLYTSVATKCLRDEGEKVRRLIEGNKLEESKHELGYLVGRDTENLTKNGVIRGIVETISENTIDGSLAPLFYMIVGIFVLNPVIAVYIYKGTNTLDSMVGYKQEPYKEIGFCSAKFDDVLNFIPARLGVWIMIFAGILQKFNYKNAVKILKRDKRNHKSPNCGYPESVTAGLLNIQLGGNNIYFGEVVEKPTIGDSCEELDSKHITMACKNLYLSVVIVTVLIGLVGIIINVNN